MAPKLTVMVPTRGRNATDKQPFLAQLRTSKRKPFYQVIVVIHKAELREFKANVDQTGIDGYITHKFDRISPIHTMLMAESPTNKWIDVDDDLIFMRRTQDGRRTEHVADISPMLKELTGYLDTYAMMGIAPKFMAQARPRGVHEFTKIDQVYAYNRSLFDGPLEWRTVTNGMHDANLRLMARGCKTALMTEWVRVEKNVGGGGCSIFRTPEVEAKGQAEVEALWPGIVKRVPCKYNICGTRIQMAWRKARLLGEKANGVL